MLRSHWLLPFLYLCVLVKVSSTVKRHHGDGGSYKGKHFIEVAVYSSEVQSFLIMVGGRAVWSRCGAGEVTESLHLAGHRKSTETLAVS